MNRRPARVGALVVTAALVAAMIGCSNDDAPTEAASDQVARGREVYAQSCASCHGQDLEGTDRGPSHLSIVYEPSHHPDGAFRAAIANGAPQHHWGFGPMPPVPGLSADDVEAVIAFVRAEQDARGFER